MGLPLKLLLTSVVIYTVSSLFKKELLDQLPESLADTIIYTQIFSFVAMIGLVLFMVWGA